MKVTMSRLDMISDPLGKKMENLIEFHSVIFFSALNKLNSVFLGERGKK